MLNVCAVSKLARANTMSLSRYQKIVLPSPNLSIGSSGGLEVRVFIRGSNGWRHLQATMESSQARPQEQLIPAWTTVNVIVKLIAMEEVISHSTHKVQYLIHSLKRGKTNRRIPAQSIPGNHLPPRRM